MSEKRIVAVDTGKGEPLCEIDLHSARRELHEEAVYQHDGETYLVQKLDLEEGKAHVTRVPPVYYTTAVEHVTLKVLQTTDTRSIGGSESGYGDVAVTEEITGYKKTRFKTHENLGYGPVSLPPKTMETEAVWLTPPAAAIEGWKKQELGAACEGAAQALHQVASLRLMCDPRDLASAIHETPSKQEEREGSLSIFLYDAHAGGVGLCDKAFEMLETLVDDASRLVGSCPCRDGCPACVGPTAKDGPAAKKLARELLAGFDTETGTSR